MVVHSAASVSFDSPLDSAVEVNLLGPSRVAAAIVSAVRLAEGQGRRGPVHFIPVSTAYVAGTHQGEAREELLEGNPFTVDVDWRTEVAAARRQRGDTDAESRRPERLAQFAKQARGELGGAGLHLLAERAERLRDDWVKKQMVTVGQARAQSLGWPDAYPYTKALGERALVSQFGATVPMTIVRPSIIESSLAEPRPGWIRGFRMAEPIIVSYARGLLREFPGVPEGVTDVIPVDLVVAAIIAVAGEALLDADRDYVGPTVYHVASGVRNPFRYGRLVELVQAWFTEHPLYDSDGQPIVVPAWSFPGRGRVQRQLTRASKAMDLAEKVVGSLPIRGRQAALDGGARGAAPPGRSGPRLRRALRRLHRDRGPLPRRPPDGPVGPHGRRRPAGLLPRPGRGGLGDLRPRHPPALDHRARPRTHLAGEVVPTVAVRAVAHRPSSRPTGTWPPSISRTP